MTSDAQMGVYTMGAYGATKAAVASMIYTYAVELADSGIRVNGLSPIAITRNTKLLGVFEEPFCAAAQPPEANTPVVDFLLSDLSADVTGQVLLIDRDEVYLYAHPALLVPPAVRPKWSAEALADVFAKEFKGRQFPCGVKGMTHLPVDLESGYQKRMLSALS